MPQFEKTYDILVTGAGVAGVAAAVAAARSGLRTALVEKTVLIGGLATAGLIYAYTPLCDGLGRQVTYGIAQELLHLSMKYGPRDVPAGWRSAGSRKRTRRYGTTFSPAAFVLALDELLLAAGVETWLDTLVCLPVMDGDRVAGVEVENKSGRGILRGRALVDATGDADVAYRAGAPCEEADNWLSLWGLQASLERAREAVSQGSGDLLLCGVSVGASNTGEGHPTGMRKFSGTNGKDVTEFVLAGRVLLRQHYERRQRDGGANSRHNLFPLALPATAPFRTTRRIAGQTTLRDGMAGQSFADSVGLVGDWSKRGEVWEIPYGSLLPRKVTGLLAAGRCISSTGHAWEVTRVIHAAAHTGEIAGVAAALAVQLDTTPDALDVGKLRQELRGKGLKLDLGDIADSD